MSNDDDDFMMESGDEEEYNFQYEDDEEGEQEPYADIENKYYNAKALKEEDPIAATTEFKGVIEMQGEKGDWGFKALKQLIKMSFKLNEIDKTLEYYKELLTYTKAAVTRNYSEKSVNSILEYVSSSVNLAFMESFYSTTLRSLEESRNDRLWMKTNLKLAKLWLDRKDFKRLNKILRSLYDACQSEDGSDDQTKGTSLLEVYALEIQMYTEMKNTVKLKDLYNRTLRVKSAIPHPRIMGIIRECGGKMYTAQGDWNAAQTEFFESFRNFDEAGSPQRIQVLKYLVLANMLAQSDIDPFEAQETAPYQKHPEIEPMVSLVNAYQLHELTSYEEILRNNQSTILNDPFISSHIEKVSQSLRTQALLNTVRPYRRVTLISLADSLSITVPQVQDIIIACILNGQINGKLDQISGVLEISRPNLVNAARHSALNQWQTNVEALWKHYGHLSGRLSMNRYEM